MTCVRCGVRPCKASNSAACGMQGYTWHPGENMLTCGGNGAGLGHARADTGTWECRTAGLSALSSFPRTRESSQPSSSIPRSQSVERRHSRAGGKQVKQTTRNRNSPQGRASRDSIVRSGPVSKRGSISSDAFRAKLPIPSFRDVQTIRGDALHISWRTPRMSLAGAGIADRQDCWLRRRRAFRFSLRRGCRPQAIFHGALQDVTGFPPSRE